MAIEYREERSFQIEQQIRNILKDSPRCVHDFYEHMHNGKRENTTQLSYIRDIVNFIKYENEQKYKEEMKDLKVDLFQQVEIEDLNGYRNYLKKERNLSNASIKRKFASLSAFYSYLNMKKMVDNNPMAYFETPSVNKKRIIKLDSDLSNRLLDGILRNDKCLIETRKGYSVVDIDDDTRLKRERLVLRNYAITCLFLGSGLRVSELVGLDLDDINFRQNSLTIIAKGGDEVDVYFGKEVAEALQEYIKGPDDDQLMIKYRRKKKLFKWVSEHAADTNFKVNLEKEFNNLDETVKSDMMELRYSFLRLGRDGLNPKKNCDAVFITTRGTRMSVRSVELMIKEMVRTYLPDYDDKDKFTPHKLRATCATRILTQTGDIQLASTQLNHKGIAVTAAFYAELQKEQQKEKMKKLDMKDW